jgi:hypothetical protein
MRHGTDGTADIMDRTRPSKPGVCRLHEMAGPSYLLRSLTCGAAKTEKMSKRTRPGGRAAPAPSQGLGGPGAGHRRSWNSTSRWNSPNRGAWPALGLPLRRPARRHGAGTVALPGSALAERGPVREGAGQQNGRLRSVGSLIHSTPAGAQLTSGTHSPAARATCAKFSRVQR